MLDFTKKYEELQNEAVRINALSEIYDQVTDRMQWNAMSYHEADDEHENVWFTEPDVDDYNYPRYMAYQEVLSAIEKLAK